MSVAELSLKPNLWLLSDGKAGHINQLRAIAQLMALPAQEVNYNRHTNIFECAESQPLPATQPTLILSIASSGRAGQLALQALPSRNLENAKRVHVMASAKPNDFYDVEVVMAHDVGRNFQPLPSQVLCHMPPSMMAHNLNNNPDVSLPELKGSLNIAVLLGGENSAFKLNNEHAYALGQKLKQIHENQDAKYYITPSRRTPKQALKAFRDGLGNAPHFVWNTRSKNPYASMIKNADVAIVSEDSISMQSDVAHVQKPFYIAEMPIKPAAQMMRRHKKYRKYSQSLIEKGFAKPFIDDCTPFAVPACKATGELVANIMRCLRT